MIFQEAVNPSLGCVMLMIEPIDWKDLIDFNTFDFDPDNGLEKEPHLTLLYGLHDDVTPDQVQDKLESHHVPVACVLHNLSLFENEKYDVLKFDVATYGLDTLNKELKTLPYTNEYDEYHPHVTVAYLKSGKGKEYVDKYKDLQIYCNFTRVLYSHTKNTILGKLRAKAPIVVNWVDELEDESDDEVESAINNEIGRHCSNCNNFYLIGQIEMLQNLCPECGHNIYALDEDATMIRKRVRARQHVDAGKSKVAKDRYKDNKSAYRKGSNDWHNSGKAKLFMKKLARYNARQKMIKDMKGESTTDLSQVDALIDAALYESMDSALSIVKSKLGDYDNSAPGTIKTKYIRSIVNTPEFIKDNDFILTKLSGMGFFSAGYKNKWDDDYRKMLQKQLIANLGLDADPKFLFNIESLFKL